MMPGALKGLLDSIRLKLQRRNESSVEVHLLNDVPPEIELSAYRRLQGSDSESPSELLSGEEQKAEPIADLDLFFERLYNYYREKGLLSIGIKWMVELLTVTFVLGFIWFFLLVVDWHALRNAKCGMEAIESVKKPCDLAKEVIKQHPLDPFTFSKGIIVGSMLILAIYGLFNFLKFFVQFKNTLKIRHFYYHCLNVTDREIGTMPWPEIIEKVVQVQKEKQLCVVKDLSTHDIIMRIMRKENYLIGMLNKGVLALPISWWVPGAGTPVSSKENRSKIFLILPKTLEWTLNWCIFQSMFDSKFCIQRDFITNPSLLQKRLVVVGIVMFAISPCLVIFMLVYLFLRHAEQFYNHPSTASSRRWSNLSKWIFREFNEVDHFFIHRVNNSVVHASNYLKQFPSPLISTIAKFISFVSGGFAAILIIIAFLDESLLEGHIFGRNLFWYAAVLGTVTAISRAMVTDELQVLDPKGAMAFVDQQTHYLPKRWRGRENSHTVRAEFETLYQYTGMMLLEEMASIFITPYLLIFVVPKRVDDILRFISDFTVDIQGVGHVCSLSVFDFERHGNRKYASPFDAPKDMRSSQGKMEKSFLSFQGTYPTWEPGSLGRQLLANLQNFREQQLRGEIQREFSPLSTRQINTNSRTQNELIHRVFCGALYNNNGIPIAGYNLTPDLRTLDWYYTSQPMHLPLPTNQTHELWQPYHQSLHGEVKEDSIEEFSIRDRLNSPFEASTSNPFFQNNSLHQHASNHRTTDHWWARSSPQLLAQQASFLEPPVFNRSGFRHPNDEFSERSFEELEEINGGNRNGRSLWRTTYMDESDNDEGLGLHFADEPKVDNAHKNMAISDIFGSPLANLPVRIIPRSNDPLE